MNHDSCPETCCATSLGCCTTLLGTDVPNRNKGSRECIINVGTLHHHAHFTTDCVPGATTLDSVSSRPIGREPWIPPILSEPLTTSTQLNIIVCSYAESTARHPTCGAIQQGTLLYVRHYKYLTNSRRGRLMIILTIDPFEVPHQHGLHLATPPNQQTST